MYYILKVKRWYIIETINKVFEVLNLENISSNDEIDFNFIWLLDNKGEEDKEETKMVQDSKLNLLTFILKRYYCFQYRLKET